MLSVWVVLFSRFNDKMRLESDLWWMRVFCLMVLVCFCWRCNSYKTVLFCLTLYCTGCVNFDQWSFIVPDVLFDLDLVRFGDIDRMEKSSVPKWPLFGCDWSWCCCVCISWSGWVLLPALNSIRDSFKSIDILLRDVCRNECCFLRYGLCKSCSDDGSKSTSSSTSTSKCLLCLCILGKYNEPNEICYWLGINLTNYLVNFNFCHVIMPSGNHTRYTRIHIHHNSHWYEKWAHCREDDIALILIISAFIVLFSPSMIIPEMISTFSFRLRLSQILWILWQHHDYGQMLALSFSNRKYTHQPKIGGQVMANANVQTITIINNASRLERRLLE